MTKIERVAEDVYVFTSELYAQVTAGAVVSNDGAAIIDTLAYPSETMDLRRFIENRIGCPVRYVINTHFHADHTYGTCLLPQAQVIGHALCRELLDTRGRAALAEAKVSSAALDTIEVVLPDILVEDGGLNLHLGDKTLSLTHSPGHSPDMITVLIREDRILFASDTVMAVPFVGDGDLEDLIKSLEDILDLELENVVQGHGEVILRGEIDSTIKKYIKYLKTIRSTVTRAVKSRYTKNALRKLDLESVGLERILLAGLAEELHWRNLSLMYDQLKEVLEPYKRRPRPKTKTKAKGKRKN